MKIMCIKIIIILTYLCKYKLTNVGPMTNNDNNLWKKLEIRGKIETIQITILRSVRRESSMLNNEY